MRVFLSLIIVIGLSTFTALADDGRKTDERGRAATAITTADSSLIPPADDSIAAVSAAIQALGCSTASADSKTDYLISATRGVMHEFYSNFTSRYLSYYLSRELPHHVGAGKLVVRAVPAWSAPHGAIPLPCRSDDERSWTACPLTHPPCTRSAEPYHLPDPKWRQHSQGQSAFLNNRQQPSEILSQPLPEQMAAQTQF